MQLQMVVATDYRGVLHMQRPRLMASVASHHALGACCHLANVMVTGFSGVENEVLLRTLLREIPILKIAFSNPFLAPTTYNC